MTDQPAPVGHSLEEIRIGLERHEGINQLVPRALSLLEANPFARGEAHAGDLLTAVLQVPRTYWIKHLDHRARLEPIMVAVEKTVLDYMYDDWAFVGAVIVDFRAAEAAPRDFGPGTPSLEQIENDFWGDPPPDTTSLVERIHELRQEPIGMLGVEGVRQLLEQREGATVLVPRALTYLEVNPLVEGLYYEGDLLAAVFRTAASYWAEHPDERARLDAICARVLGLHSALLQQLVPDLRKQIDAFRAGSGEP